MFTLLFYKIQKKPHEKSEVCMVTQAFGSSNYLKDKEQILICLSLIK